MIIKATIISENKTTSKLYFFHFIDKILQIVNKSMKSVYSLLNGRAVTQMLATQATKNYPSG